MRKTYIYTVRPGDTVYSIAQRYRSSVQEILRINYDGSIQDLIRTGVYF
ncbi:LysM peptidoglycan-binding domain-containing protein [Mesobacillus maritimus]